MTRTYNPLTLSPEQQAVVSDVLAFFRPQPIPCDWLVNHIQLGCQKYGLPIPSAVLVARYLREHKLERRNMYAWFFTDTPVQAGEVTHE